MTITSKLKFLLMAPLFVVPFLCVVFNTLGGGHGSQHDPTARAMGLNTQLPAPSLSVRQMLENKISAYRAADQDSMRKREALERDKYLLIGKADSIRALGLRRTVPAQAVIQKDPKAEQLLQQLGRLQQSMRGQGVAAPPARVEMPTLPLQRPLVRPADIAAADPQLEKLNNMLDKVIRIQNPAEKKPVATSENAEAVLPADSASNAIAAVIPMDQTLVTGGTIAFRLEEDIKIHALLIPRGQWVYGVVTINNDRMMVHIRSLRSDRSLYNTDLQVYDLDGLPGIHIPGMISRDVAKESADEGVSGLNVTSYDPTLGAQAANAGIQAAKTLFGRKIRLVRVSVRAGYQVLLRNTQPTTIINKRDSPVLAYRSPQPPGFVPGGSFLQRSRTEGMELDLQGIYQDSLLWIALRWSNHSPIGYVPDYYRWVIRDKRPFRRTAQQELPVEPVYSPGLAAVNGDSIFYHWTGFRPFALAKDKELLLEVGERNGGRTLTLVIDHKHILHAIIPTHDETNAEQ